MKLKIKPETIVNKETLVSFFYNKVIPAKKGDLSLFFAPKGSKKGETEIEVTNPKTVQLSESYLKKL